MTPEVITFDCYGTLIDWESGILGALRPVLDAHRIDLDDSALLELYAEIESREQRGPYRDYKTILRSVMDGIGLRLDFPPAPAERDALVASLPGWQPFPDTVAALAALKRRYRLGIISNVDDDLFAGTARHLGVTMDWVITAESIGAYKPARKVFETALARLDVPHGSLLHAAQSLYHDIAPAREMGLATVWVNRRHRVAGPGATPPAAARPDHEVKDLAGLAAWLGVG